MARKEMNIEEVRALLLKACEAAGGQRAFAAENGIAVQYVNAVVRGQRSPSDVICSALGIEDAGRRWRRK